MRDIPVGNYSFDLNTPSASYEFQFSVNDGETNRDILNKLARLINSANLGLKTEIFTPFVCGAFTSLYSKDAVEESFAQGKIVFFAGGTGHPYFSTDTATVLRAVEIEAEAILLAKAVDGIYDSDPKTNPNAVRYDEVSIEEVVAKKLQAMDLTASIMCMEQKMPMLVFALDEEDSIINAVHGKFTGTKVTV